MNKDGEKSALRFAGWFLRSPENYFPDVLTSGFFCVFVFSQSSRGFSHCDFRWKNARSVENLFIGINEIKVSSVKFRQKKACCSRDVVHSVWKLWPWYKTETETIARVFEMWQTRTLLGIYPGHDQNGYKGWYVSFLLLLLTENIMYSLLKWPGNRCITAICKNENFASKSMWLKDVSSYIACEIIYFILKGKTGWFWYVLEWL